MANGRREVDVGARITWGIVLLALSLFLALSLLSYDWRDISVRKVPPTNTNLIGPVGAWLSFVLFSALGVGAYLMPLLCGGLALLFMFNRRERVWPRAVWCGVLALAAVSIVGLEPGAWLPVGQRLNIAPDTGGLVGRLLVRGLLVKWVGPAGAWIMLLAVGAIAFVMLVEMENILSLARGIAARARGVARRTDEAAGERAAPGGAGAAPPRPIQQRLAEREQQIRKEAELVAKQRRKTAPVPVPRPAEKTVAAAPPKPAEPADTPVRQRAAPPPPRPAPEEEPPAGPPPSAPPPAARPAGAYQLPPLDLLEPTPPSKNREIEADSAVTGRILVETLKDFGIEAEVANVERGPVVTRYELLPAPGVRVEKIASLSNNLAMSLKTSGMRVQTPVPGKGVVGIEVPNTTASKVYVREILEGAEWKSGKARLPLVLGKDVGGSDLIADLTDMPHLLIAGATGAGKTVCMNAVLTGLLMARTPDEMRLLLVDPKIVEFGCYNDLPHLVVPVITNPKKVALGLRWAINEMERRYRLFAKVGVRNIESYNHRPIARQTDLFGNLPAPQPASAPPDRLPYIVIVIDELADLMQADQADVENCIARLAQLSRAVGVHMILSTQRPSVDVITGTIKANFPARIAFQVAQKTDSRTILDTIGAEKLLGRGDMLFLPPGSSKGIRAQGAMVSDADIRAVTDHIRGQAAPAFELEIQQRLEKAETERPDDAVDEELVQKALQIIRETERASTSSLQRRLKLGYTRAARVIDVLEQRGVLGPPRGAEPREILIDLDGEIQNNETAEEETPEP